MSATVLDGIRQCLVRLKMPCALELNVEWLLMSSRLNKLVLLQILSLDLTRH